MYETHSLLSNVSSILSSSEGHASDPSSADRERTKCFYSRSADPFVIYLMSGTTMFRENPGCVTWWSCYLCWKYKLSWFWWGTSEAPLWIHQCYCMVILKSHICGQIKMLLKSEVLLLMSYVSGYLHSLRTYMTPLFWSDNSEGN